MNLVEEHQHGMVCVELCGGCGHNGFIFPLITYQLMIIGYALAYAVIQFFCTHIDACVMFSTHYHSLVEELKDDKVLIIDKIRRNNETGHSLNSFKQRIGLFHMSCYIEDEISFLYTLERGLASCSFGMNVAQVLPSLISKIPPDYQFPPPTPPLSPPSLFFLF